MTRIVIGILLILLGVSALSGISIFNFFIAFILIWFGVRLIIRSGRLNWDTAGTSTSQDVLNELAIFSPINRRIISDNFKGGKITLIFSGGQIDLGQSKPAHKEIILEINSIFGGAKVIVPKDWKVDIESTSIFGGYNDRTQKEESATHLKIKGAAIFGGVELVN